MSLKRHVVFSKGLPHVMALSFPQREIDELSTRCRSTQHRSHHCSIANLRSYSPLLLRLLLEVKQSIWPTLKGWRLQNLGVFVFFSEAVYHTWLISSGSELPSSPGSCLARFPFTLDSRRIKLISVPEMLHTLLSPECFLFTWLTHAWPVDFSLLVSIISPGSISWLFFLSYPIRIRIE